LVLRGVLSVVDEPTHFVGQMAIVEKADHSLRICIRDDWTADFTIQSHPVFEK